MRLLNPRRRWCVRDTPAAHRGGCYCAVEPTRATLPVPWFTPAGRLGTYRLSRPEAGFRVVLRRREHAGKSA